MKMKRYFLTIGLILMLVLTGCGVVSDVTNTVEYIDETSEYINAMTKFSNDANSLFSQAVEDPAATTELINQLTNLKKEMLDFNNLTPPEAIQETHQQLVDANAQMITAIEGYENGSLQIQELLQNNELLQTIQGLNDTLQQLENFQP
jgi:hypothetical protein